MTVKVYDSQNVLVRTLANGSQATGLQSVVWDGKNDGAAILPTGTYTIKVNATDGEGLAAPEQVVSVTITRQATTTYDYDRLYRLTTVTAPSGSTSYDYDPVGNRKTMTRGSATSYVYDRVDRLQTAGMVSYTVNDNGNLVARGPDSFTYDQANRLKTATLGTTISTYSYDGDGKRVSATVGANPTVTYRYDVNRGLPVVLDDGTRKYVWGLGLAYAVDGAGNVEVYHQDGLGSVRAITDASALVVQTYQTDEFGVATLTQGTDNQAFQYTGEQRDGETGFVYLRARYYDPGLGRFLTRDPRDSLRCDQNVPDTFNRYSYGANNPVNRVDPAGLKSQALQEFAPEVLDGAATQVMDASGNQGQQLQSGAWCVRLWTPWAGWTQTCFPGSPPIFGQARQGTCIAKGQLAGGLPKCQLVLGKYYSGKGTGSTQGGASSEACKAAKEAAEAAMKADIGTGCYLRHVSYKWSP